jgi:hypothetical protein
MVSNKYDRPLKVSHIIAGFEFIKITSPSSRMERAD